MAVWKPNLINITSGKVAPGKVPVGPPDGGELRRQVLRAIQEAAQARDMDRAAELAQSALDVGVEHPLVFNVLAFRLEQQGELAAGLEMLVRAQASAPDDPGLRQSSGLLRLRLERHAEAVADFDVVLAAQPDFAPALAARAQALAAVGRLTEAEGGYRRALELQPENIAALAGLAALLGRGGAHAEARPLAERVLAAQPNFPEAVTTLAAADLAEGKPEAAAQRLEGLIADPRLSPQERALAQGLMGDVLDAQGQVAEAFEAYTACNLMLRQAYAQGPDAAADALGFAREALARIDTLGALAWASEGAAPVSPVARHVFLLGFPRSGTTLLEQVLASHPEVEALEERDTLSEAARVFMTSPEDLERLTRATEAELAPLRAAYWARVRAEGARPADKVFVDKHPLNTFKLPLIARLFPEAKVLIARRDPRDVVLSCYRRRFAMSSSAYQLLTLPTAAAFYDVAMQIADRFEPVLADRALAVRHEGLVTDFDAVAREVCDFLGLPWTEDLRAFAERVRERGVATPSGAQLAGGLSAEGIGSWRRYGAQLAPVLPVLAPWAERFGYEPQ